MEMILSILFLAFYSSTLIIGIVNIIRCGKYKIPKSKKFTVLSLIIIIWQILGDLYWISLVSINDMGKTASSQPKILYIVRIIRILAFPIVAISIFIILRKKIKQQQAQTEKL